MRKLLTFLILMAGTSLSLCQNVFNPYQKSDLTKLQLTLGQSISNPIYTWYHRTDNVTPFSGEYVIQLARHPWRFWEGPPHFIHISYSMEVVSFPFTTSCAFSPNGCAGTIGRPFEIPTDPYDPLTDKWGNITNYIHNQDLNQINQALVSVSFLHNTPLGIANTTLPHTIIKHTINLHCGTHTSTAPFPPILYSHSWVYDNTRGMMKLYPFCSQNCGGWSSSPNCCTNSNDYDIAYYPEIISGNGQLFNTQEETLLVVDGTLDYFPYNELQLVSTCSNPSLTIPFPTDQFIVGAGIYQFPFAPPYSLLNATPLQNEGEVLGGFNTNIIDEIIEPRPGIEHSYNINQSINLNDISKFDRTIYNPSDVLVSAGDLRFPSHYTFKTIRAIFPSKAIVDIDNTIENGGIYSDRRLVPVRTDLRSEDPTYPHDASILEDSRYASLYKLQSGSKITIEPCVKIFDAAFILNSGSTLKYENYNTQIGYYPDNHSISRVAIDRNGGRLIRQYDNTLPNATLYLQYQTEVSNAPNSYIVDGKIMAGSNVDPLQTAGPYIASSGTALELIAKNYVKLENGFQAHAGSEVKIAVDPTMNIPICPPIPPAPSNNSRIYNSQSNELNSTASKAVITPNPVQQFATVSLLQSGNSNIIQRIQLHDAKGQLLFTKDNINNASEQLDAQNLTDGLYFLTVTTNSNTETLKFIVSKNY